MKGSVMQLQNFSVNDGEGIRTTVFLAGCPLHCPWCANPEGLTIVMKMAYYERQCRNCGRCVLACPLHIPVNLNERRDDCVACGLCANVCPSGARKLLVGEKTVEEIVAEIKPQIPFFRHSGGGVTFSGGEATMQTAFLQELSAELYDLGVDLCLETCAYFNFHEIKEILNRMSLVFVDIKHMDSRIHQEYTGVGNELILENIALMATLPIEIVVRVPLICGVNESDENIRQTAEFVKKTLPKAKMELLPYHAYGEAKYEALGQALPSASFSTPSSKRIDYLEKMIETMGVSSIRFR